MRLLSQHDIARLRHVHGYRCTSIGNTPNMTIRAIRDSMSITMTTSGRHTAIITGTAVRATVTIAMTTMITLLTVGNLSSKRLISISSRISLLKSSLIGIKSLPVRH